MSEEPTVWVVAEKEGIIEPKVIGERSGDDTGEGIGQLGGIPESFIRIFKWERVPLDAQAQNPDEWPNEWSG